MNLPGKMISFTLFSLLITGFAGAGEYSIGVPRTAWRTSTLKACWQSSASRASSEVEQWALKNHRAELPTRRFQKIFSEWIRSAYSINRVGVALGGLGECPDDSAALAAYPVYLIDDIDLSSLFQKFFDAETSRKTLGMSVIGDPNSYSPARRKTVIEFRPSSHWPALSLPKIVRQPYRYKAAVGFDFEAAQNVLLNQYANFFVAMNSMLGFELNAKIQNKTQKKIAEETAKELALDLVDIHHFTALHEVGHLFGLLHEDRRIDAKDARPKYCLNVAGDDGREVNGVSATPLRESRFGTAYDPFSIMSYCRQTMHHLLHEARLVCRLAPSFDDAVRGSISDFLKHCEEIEKIEFPVDLSRRDVNSLRQIYLHTAPGVGADADFRKSQKESQLFKILDLAARLPFDVTTSEAMKTGDLEKNR